jgi:hypothetical protein
MGTRHYHIQLSDEERETILDRLRRSEAPGPQLAERIASEHGEEDLLSLAASRLRAWYYGRVRDVTEDALGQILSGELEDEDALEQWLHETIDQSDVVIYTHKAKCALLASNNEDALEEETGEARADVGARAYYAMRADVRETLETLVNYPPDGLGLPEGFDLSDSTTWRGPSAATAGEGR